MLNNNKDKLYIPMSFWSENDYVYYSDTKTCKTLEETLEYINQANNRIDKFFRYTMGQRQYCTNQNA